MAIVKTDDKHYKNIANKIRQLGSGNATYKPEEMAQGVHDAAWKLASEEYALGFSNGNAIGMEEGIEQGKQAEYDRFWDEYQYKGATVNYDGAFHGQRWNKEVFKPKYDIKPTSAYMMFRDSGIKDDLVEILSGLGVELDFSASSSMQYTFSLCRFTRIGTINASKAAEYADTFSYAYYLETIEKIVISESQRCNSSCFERCDELKNITFEGVIGKSITFKHSPLTKESFINVVNTLSATVTGQTATFKKTAKEAAFTADEWAALIATKSNWTFSLV